MAPPLTLTIHRAAHEIGGNCIELALGAERILLDMGRPLTAPKEARGLLPASLDTQRPATILISHPHQDHYGLLEEAPPTWPVRCGELFRSACVRWRDCAEISCANPRREVGR